MITKSFLEHPICWHPQSSKKALFTPERGAYQVAWQPFPCHISLTWKEWVPSPCLSISAKQSRTCRRRLPARQRFESACDETAPPRRQPSPSHDEDTSSAGQQIFRSRQQSVGEMNETGAYYEISCVGRYWVGLQIA